MIFSDPKAFAIEAYHEPYDHQYGWFEEQLRKTAPPFFPINPFDLNEKVPGKRND